MKKNILWITLWLLMAFVSAAQAEVKTGSYSVTPFIGGYLFEGNQELKHSPVYGLRGGYHFTKNWAMEGVFDYVATKYKAVATEPSVNAYGLGIEGLYHFLPEGRLVPFVAAGTGWQRLSGSDAAYNDRNRIFLDYGAGLKYFLTDNVALRADVRHVLPFNDTYNNLLYTIGITFAFGGEKKATMAERAAEPAAAPVVEVKRDSDGDGVFDDKDRCPDTPRGVAVDENGCPLDSDRDGVPDYLDKCPGTPSGVMVDKDGCPVRKPEPVPEPQVQRVAPQAASAVETAIIEKGRVTLNVEFDFDKAVVKPKYHDVISHLADVLKKYQDLKITIEGHTDNVGGAKYNEKLSQRRADAIKKVLVDKYGIEASRLTAKGYGLTRPVTPNTTKEGRQKNRRVEAAAEYTIKK